MAASVWWEDKETLEAIKDQIYARGLVILAQEDSHEVNRLPVVLQPSLFPMECFELAVKVQPSFNSVLDAVSRDIPMMNETFSKIASYDSFIQSLYEIFSEVQKQGNVQVTTFGIHRSDYLVDRESVTTEESITAVKLKQVEINTISSALAAHSLLVSHLHRYIIDRYIGDSVLVQGKLVDNECSSKICDGMAVAYREYGKSSAYILFVVQEKERNRFDQRLIEYELWERHSIKVIRRTLTEIAEQGQLTASRELFIEGLEIAVVYYRAGYAPDDYPSDKEWGARKMMELSRASNCPSVAYQLVGCKKMQQLLSEDGALEKYCTDNDAVREMRSTFAKQYSLELNSKGDEAVQKALTRPDQYVLKPQREGGGNNFYGQELQSLLSSMISSPEREAYILMDCINSPALPNAILESGHSSATECNLICELGIYGIFVQKDGKVLLNEDAGYLIRSKPTGVTEGRVIVNRAALDSPWLVPSDVYIENIKCSDF